MPLRDQNSRTAGCGLEDLGRRESVITPKAAGVTAHIVQHEELAGVLDAEEES
jgi:hypothetical protein